MLDNKLKLAGRNYSMTRPRQIWCRSPTHAPGSQAMSCISSNYPSTVPTSTFPRNNNPYFRSFKGLYREWPCRGDQHRSRPAWLVQCAKWLTCGRILKKGMQLVRRFAEKHACTRTRRGI